MAERRGRPRLILEAPTVLSVGGQPGMKQFDGDRATEPGVPTSTDFCHAATSDDIPQLIPTAEQLAGRHVITVNPDTSALAG